MILFLLCFLVFLFFFLRWSDKYVNRYTLTMVFGKKGSGKSTYLTKLAMQHYRKGWEIYSNFPIPCAHIFNPADLGHFNIPEHSLVIIDEVGLVWHNRNFKSFDPQVREFFKLQRKCKIKVVLASQSFDVDKGIRDLCDDMFLMQKRCRVFTYGKRILKQLDIIEAQGEAESRIVDQLKFDSLLWFWLGSRSLTYIPKYTLFFESFDKPIYDDKEYVTYHFEDGDLIETCFKDKKEYRRYLCNSLFANLRNLFVRLRH